MASIDLSKSAFANAGAIEINTPAATETSWRTHVVSHLATLAKTAAVVTTLALCASPAFGADLQEVEPSGTAISTPADLAIVNSYRAEMLSSKIANVWQSARTDLQIVRTFDGVDHKDDRALSSKLGVDLESFDEFARRQVQDSDASFVAVGKSSPAIALTTPLSFFHPETAKQGSVCVVQINADVLDSHKKIAAATGWKDDVVRDYVVRHEMSHCLEQSDFNVEFNAKFFGTSIEPSTLTAARKAGIDSFSPLRKLVNGSAPDADSIMEKMSRDIRTANTHEIRHQGEQYADGLAMLSLLAEGRVGVNDIQKLANFRGAKGPESIHNTHGFLAEVANALQKDPELVKSFQRENSASVESGQGIKIEKLESWLKTVWTGHADNPHDKNDASAHSKAAERASRIVNSSLFSTLSQQSKPAAHRHFRP